jgi:hypothetical protein
MPYTGLAGGSSSSSRSSSSAAAERRPSSSAAAAPRPKRSRADDAADVDRKIPDEAKEDMKEVGDVTDVLQALLRSNREIMKAIADLKTQVLKLHETPATAWEACSKQVIRALKKHLRAEFPTSIKLSSNMSAEEKSSVKKIAFDNMKARFSEDMKEKIFSKHCTPYLTKTRNKARKGLGIEAKEVDDAIESQLTQLADRIGSCRLVSELEDLNVEAENALCCHLRKSVLKYCRHRLYTKTPTVELMNTVGTTIMKRKPLSESLKNWLHDLASRSKRLRGDFNPQFPPELNLQDAREVASPHVSTDEDSEDEVVDPNEAAAVVSDRDDGHNDASAPNDDGNAAEAGATDMDEDS